MITSDTFHNIDIHGIDIMSRLGKYTRTFAIIMASYNATFLMNWLSLDSGWLRQVNSFMHDLI